eukprot:362274-Chlamydomonas_euryale.AAC.3
MAVSERDGITAVACLTVEIVLTPTHTADTTVVAVILLLAEVVVKEVAFQTCVPPKCCCTVCARLRYRLPCITLGTDHFTHCLAVQSVALLWVLHPHRRSEDGS